VQLELNHVVYRGGDRSFDSSLFGCVLFVKSHDQTDNRIGMIYFMYDAVCTSNLKIDDIIYLFCALYTKCVHIHISGSLFHKLTMQTNEKN
jgi:hypothetical protein